MSLADWANAATVVTGFAALFAIAFAVWQTREFRYSQLEALAREQYQHFLELCMQHADYASPGSELDVEAQTLAGDRRKFVEYEWFFAVAANALEAIYLSVGHEQCWEEAIFGILIDHTAYLTSPRYDEVQRSTADSGFQRFIDGKFPKRSARGEKVVSIVPEAAE